MATRLFDDYTIEVLSSRHDRADFDCGIDALDAYLKFQAGQDARRNVAAPFVLVSSDGFVAGFYTLSANSVAVTDIPEEMRRKLPRYPILPATLIGRLAIDRRHKGQGLGRMLIADAFYKTISSDIAAYAVVVDAKSEDAAAYYEREGFIAFADQPMRLFRPVADIRKLFGL